MGGPTLVGWQARNNAMQMDSRASPWVMVGRGPRAIDRQRYERCVPQRRKPASLFHHRAASTLLAIEIEMVSGLRRAARGRVASPLRGAEGADAASRRLKLAVLAVHPDVNRPSPASIGRVASSSGLAAVACGPDAPVGFPSTEWSVQSIWMGRQEPRDANGLAGIVVGDGCPWAASH